MSFIPPRHSDAEHNLKMHQENVCSVGAHGRRKYLRYVAHAYAG